MLFGLSLLVLLYTSYRVETFPSPSSTLDEDGPEVAWEKLEALINTSSGFEGEWQSEAIIVPSFKTSPPVMPPPLNLPFFNGVESPVDSNLFKPEPGTRAVPGVLKALFLPPAPTKPAPAQQRIVDALCHLDRMYVRIVKTVFVNPYDAWRYLKIGTCPVNRVTGKYYYFLYYLKGCGIDFKEQNSLSTYSNTVTYNPPATGPILRDLPFSVKVICKYYKHFNAYAIGYYPVVQPETLFARLPQSSRISLTPYDDKWNPLGLGHSFTIGKPINFEAKVPPTKAADRTYINKCYMTAAGDPNSSPKYMVIGNNGCLVDSKMSSSSRFIPYTDKNTLRFSIGAFVFKDSTTLPTGQRTLYMHCEIIVGPVTATPSAKSCTYDMAAKRWKELYGGDDVCLCCESSCPSAVPDGSMKMVSSDPWEWTSDMEMSETPTESVAIPELIEASGSHEGFEKFWSGENTELLWETE